MSVKGSIFREFIGSKSDPEIEYFPEEIVNSRIPEFHFILGHATEEYVEKKGQGNFRPDWDVGNFSVKSIQELKEKHKNVKVIISVGGGNNIDFPFNPQDKEIWIEMAKKSLKDIILHQYKSECGCTDTKTVIDGIDIHYEYMGPDITQHDFEHCIGKVVDYLRAQVDGLVVSISPSNPVLSYYERFYRVNPHRIRWVNYQYYHEKVPSKDAFINRHKTLIDTFSVEKLLAGFSTNKNFKDNLPLEVFLEGCQRLIKTASLAGIFVSNAQDSIIYHPSDFFVEKKAQEIITGFDD